MFQPVHERISVAGIYHQGKFTPRKFQWRKHTFVIKEVTYAADFNDAGVHQRQYSVVAQQQVYRLLFQRDREEWWLEEVWDDAGLAAY